MKIQIKERLRPFSHTAGTSCVIPKSTAVLKAYPTLLQVDLQDKSYEYLLPIQGPVEGFTLQQDLERQAVFVFGRAKEGFFRIRIEAKDSAIVLEGEKGLVFSKTIPISLNTPQKTIERLSLGSHKKQDWDHLRKRKDLKEILPFLFSLAQMLPSSFSKEEAIQFPKEKKELERYLNLFFLSFFEGIGVPRISDEEHQGLSLKIDAKVDRFSLLKELEQKLRALFFFQEGDTLSFLPELLPSFHAGRMIHLEAKEIGIVDLEWTKKKLKRVWIHTKKERTVHLKLPKEIQRFRMNKKESLLADTPLLLKANRSYFFDRFEK